VNKEATFASECRTWQKALPVHHQMALPRTGSLRFFGIQLVAQTIALRVPGHVHR
jgi:hypothetical protein